MGTVLRYPVAELVTRLDQIDLIKTVALAPDLSAALKTPPRAEPAVFVLAETRGQAIKFTGPPLQQERITRITLVKWVRNHGGAIKVRQEMDKLDAAIDLKLAGWRPSGAFDLLRMVATRDEFSHAQYLVTQSTYESSWNFSAPLQA